MLGPRTMAAQLVQELVIKMETASMRALVVSNQQETAREKAAAMERAMEERIGQEMAMGTEMAAARWKQLVEVIATAMAEASG